MKLPSLPYHGRILVLVLFSLITPLSSHADSLKPESLGQLADKLFGTRTEDPIATNKRAIRVLVTYNATNYFVVSGQQRGLEYELMLQFEKMLNKNIKQADKKRHMVFIPVPFDQLIPSLLQGKGDIVAAGLTLTPERAAKAAFSKPYRNNVTEIVVRSSKASPVKEINGLAGKKVHVLRGSSYVQHLKEFNQRLKKQGLKPVKIIETDEHLTSEDILQMVNAGIYDYTIVDDHIANLWQQVLKGMVAESGARLHQGGKIAWAVRKNNQQLLAKLNEFVTRHRQGTIMGNMLFNRYYKDTKWIVNPVNDKTLKRLQQYQAAFQKYGNKYHIDWVFLIAQGFQESKLNQNKRSRSGAVGVMQIKPSTAKDKNVGISGVRESADKNIHAAVKYMDFIRKQYFSDPAIDPLDQVAMTLAAYNAGPARIYAMRKKTKAAGLNPNVWFGNVEQITNRYTGNEPVNYVANIFKYYIAFKATIEAEARRKQAAGKSR